MKFTIYQESRIGRRKNNQDRIAHCYSREALLMVLADGMGGHLGGEVAAQIAVQYITEAFQREAVPRLADPFLFLANSLTNAHNAIIDYGNERDLNDAPRTTCVACIIQDNIAYWAHAGDSRLYAIRDGRMLAQTRDHSRVQMMVDEGMISAEEALHHPGRNKVFSCLGGNAPPQVDFSRKTPLLAGDVLVLSTDGFWVPVGVDALLHAYRGGSVMEVTPRLMDEAELLAGDGCDNLSAIAVSWEDSYADVTTTGAVETQTMPVDAHTTLLEGFEKYRGRDTEFTDDDIEKAIDEIRSAIRKYSK